VALYGRRRVGKTLLLQTNAAKHAILTISVTGISKASNSTQLALFQREIESKLYAGARLPRFKNWQDAFSQLTAGLKANPSSGPVAIILDELPWLAGRKSDLLQALDHNWNTELQYEPRLKLFLCGSAASWMLSKIIRAKGGLHNRLTLSLRLLPFTFLESVNFIRSRGAEHWSDRDLIEIFMALGGVPYYLSLIDPTLSPTQNISRLYFSTAATLREEFDTLFGALFGPNPLYRLIVEVLAEKRSGLTRKALLLKLNGSSGGLVSRILTELEEAGFITKLPSFGKRKREFLFKLWDEFSLFWLKWGERSSLGDAEKFWIQSRQSPAFYSWAGYAFENLCLKEVESLKTALGIADVKTWAGPAMFRGADGRLFQFDLILDRADRTVSVVEIKHSEGEFSVDTKFALELEQRRQVAQRVFGKSKTIQLCLVATDGVNPSTSTERLNLRCFSSRFLFTDLQRE